jgi:hypothetical protein
MNNKRKMKKKKESVPQIFSKEGALMRTLQKVH